MLLISLSFYFTLQLSFICNFSLKIATNFSLNYEKIKLNKVKNKEKS